MAETTFCRRPPRAMSSHADISETWAAGSQFDSIADRGAVVDRRRPTTLVRHHIRPSISALDAILSRIGGSLSKTSSGNQERTTKPIPTPKLADPG